MIHQTKVETLAAKKPSHSPKELVSPCYHQYLNVFLEKATSWFLLQKPWDHTIDITDTVMWAA